MTLVAAQATAVGVVVARLAAPVVVQRALGAAQPLDDPLGSPLPRIC
jgi:hydrogenase maturation factor